MSGASAPSLICTKQSAMRIPCPFCGERDVREFGYLGDATASRPDPDGPDATGRFIDYVYFRDNPAGPHREFWYHGFGCQAWLVVVRDTRTHEIFSAEPASKAAVRS
jgi:heterotetrameric sarcosine oxidase delta subunit